MQRPHFATFPPQLAWPLISSASILAIHVGFACAGVLGEATQPRRLTSGDLNATPLDRLTDRKPLVLGHLGERLPCSAVSFNHGCIPFTDGDQHAHRQILQPLLALGTFPTPLGLRIQRRPPSLLSDRLMTHHVTLPSLRTVIPP